MAKTTVQSRPVSKPPVPTSDQMPDFMRADAGLGTDNISSEDIDTPRLKLIQALSPEIQQFNKLRPGNFFHSAAEHIFDEPFRVVILYYDKRFILWNPRDSGGGILARADDGVHWSPPDTEFAVKLDKKDGGAQVKWKTGKTVKESGLDAWGSSNPNDPNSGPAATQMFNYLLAFPDHPDLMPAVLTFQRSSIKIGRKLNAKIKTVRAPLFGQQWLLSSFMDTNRSGQDFHNIQMQGAGLVQDAEQYKMYKGLYENFARTGIQVKDIEGLQDEDDATGDEPEETVETRAGGRRPRY